MQCLGTFIISGDLNIHVDDANDAHATRLVDLLRTFDCVQHVSEPTHLAGHTLDVVISRADTDIRQLSVGSFVSDHALISFKFSLRRTPAAAAADVQRRKWRNYLAADIRADLAASRLCADLSSPESYSPDDLAILYESKMTSLLDKHCPKVAVKRKQSTLTPWLDAECREARRGVRTAERRYRRTRQQVDRTKWLRSLMSLHSLYERKNQLYWRDKIDDCKGDSRSLWRTLSDIMSDKKGSRRWTSLC